MNSSILRGLLLTASSAAVMTMASPAFAAGVQFNIPSQELNQALRAFALQSGAPISFRGEIVGDARSNSTIGTYEPQAALAVMLRGTGLDAVRVQNGWVVLSGAQRPAIIRIAEQQVVTAGAGQQSQPVVAAASDPNTVAGLEEITVTARRVSENIQDVPVTITAFSADTLERKDTRDFAALSRSIPGVTLCCGANNAGFYIYVRGIGGGSAPTYFGGAPAPVTGFANSFDLENVQVLKGPQGTLFGQAANGGAFIYEPRRPSEYFGGYVTGTVGDYGRRGIEGAINVPLMEGKILTRVAAKSFSRDGYVHDLSNNKKYLNQDYYVIRPQVTVKIGENFENNTLVQYSYSQNNGNDNAWVLWDFNFNIAQVPSLSSQAPFNGGTAPAFNALRDQLLARQRQLGRYTIDGLSVGCATSDGPIFGPRSVTSLNYTHAACPYGESSSTQLINTSTWSFAEGWTLKNIYSYRWGTTGINQPGDTDGTLLLLQDGGSPRNGFKTKSSGPFSNEVQLIGSNILDRFDLTLGAFYTSTQNHPYVTYGLQFGNAESASISKTSSWSKAVFGQTNIHLNEVLQGLTATVGARYTWDKLRSHGWTLNPTTLAVVRETGGPGSPAGEAEFARLSYNLSLQYALNEQTMLYITNAKGYSAGGLQNVVGNETFSPDSLNNVEVGAKSTFRVGDAVARVNAAYYNGRFDNIKVPVWTLVTNPVTGVTAPANITRNAAAALIRGFEIDGALNVGPFEFGGFAAYNYNKYTSWPTLNQFTGQMVDVRDTPFVWNPKWKYGIRGAYKLPIDEAVGEVRVTADFNHRDFIYFQGYPRTPLNAANPRTGSICTRQRTAANGYGPLSADNGTAWVDCIPAQDDLTLSADWRDIMGHVGLSANFSVTNVTKNEVTESECGCDQVSGFTSMTPAAPRMWSLNVRYQF